MSANENDNVSKFEPPIGNATPRELLIRVLADVDDISELIIVGRAKDGEAFCSGHTCADKFAALGLMDAMKHRMLAGMGPATKVKA